MALAAFDTLEIFEELEKAGFEESKAKAISAAVRKAYQSSPFATKEDVVNSRKDTQQSIEDLRKDTKQDIADLRKDTQQEFAQVRREIDDLRKDAKQNVADVRREISDLRKDMDTQFVLMGARFEKRLLHTAVVLGALSLVGPNIGTLLRLFH